MWLLKALPINNRDKNNGYKQQDRRLHHLDNKIRRNVTFNQAKLVQVEAGCSWAYCTESFINGMMHLVHFLLQQFNTNILQTVFKFSDLTQTSVNAQRAQQVHTDAWTSHQRNLQNLGTFPSTEYFNLGQFSYWHKTFRHAQGISSSSCTRQWPVGKLVREASGKLNTCPTGSCDIHFLSKLTNIETTFFFSKNCYFCMTSDGLLPCNVVQQYYQFNLPMAKCRPFDSTQTMHCSEMWSYRTVRKTCHYIQINCYWCSDSFSVSLLKMYE